MTSKKKKILFICTEDWFFHSHFLPLIEAARKIETSEICLATTAVDKFREIEQLGVRIIPVDFDRASMGVLSGGRVAVQLLRVIRREKPDLIHFIALKPILLGGIARFAWPSSVVIYHVTGLGTLAEGKNLLKRMLKSVIFRLPGIYMRMPRSALFVENPDDRDYLHRHGLPPAIPVTILGGAGINPDIFPPQHDSGSEILHLAFVGRMISTKGVDVLVEAMALCSKDGVRAHLDLYGVPDIGNPGSYSQQLIDEWSRFDNINWHGHAHDIIGVWKKADICVVPTRTREGMPRAMLEAASCAKPLIVTDVPGCRHFVRNGVEGLVVPPEDPRALAEAISKLANDFDLRAKMGEAARQRVLGSFTEQHVIKAVAEVYQQLLS